MSTLHPGSVKSVCKHWISGNCQQGSSCVFLHGQESQDYINTTLARIPNLAQGAAFIGSMRTPTTTTTHTVLPQANTTPHLQSEVAQPLHSGFHQHIQSGLGQPIQSGLGQPMQSGLGQPIQSGLGQPLQSGLAHPMQSVLPQSLQSGLTPSMQSGLIQVQMTPQQYQQHLLITQAALLGQPHHQLPLSSGLAVQPSIQQAIQPFSQPAIQPDSQPAIQSASQPSTQQAISGGGLLRSGSDSGPEFVGANMQGMRFDQNTQHQMMQVGGTRWQEAALQARIEQSQLLYANDALRLQQTVLAPSQQIPMTQNPAFAGSLGMGQPVLMPPDPFGLTQASVVLPQARTMVLGQQCLLPPTGTLGLGQESVMYQADIGQPLITQANRLSFPQQNIISQAEPKFLEEVASVPSSGIVLQPNGGPRKKKSRFHDIDEPDPNEQKNYNPEQPTEDEDHVVDFVDRIMAGITPKIIQPEELTKKKPISFKNMFVPSKSIAGKAAAKVETGQIYRTESRSRKVPNSSRRDSRDYSYGDGRDARKNDDVRQQRYDTYDPQKSGREEELTHSHRRHETQGKYSQDYRHRNESSVPRMDDHSVRPDQHRSHRSREGSETSQTDWGMSRGVPSRMSGESSSYGHQPPQNKKEGDIQEVKSSTVQAKTDEDLGIKSHRHVEFQKAMPDFIKGFMITAGKYKGGLIRVTKTYHLPGNCIGLCPPKMNTEAWEILTKKAQTRDEILQDFQRWFASGIIPLVMQADRFGKNSQSVKEVCRSTSDALNVLAYVCMNMSIKRRLLMRYSLHSKYRLLCRKEHPVSDLLFGSNLATDLLALKAGHFKISEEEKKNREDNNDDPEADNYKPMFFANLALPGQYVDESVASMVNMTCSNDGDVSDLRETYKIPSNCMGIVAPAINPQVWSLVSRSGLDLDNRLQDVHLSVAEGMVPLMVLLESIHEKKYDENDALSLLTHTLLLLCNSMYQLNTVRMDAMRKSLPEKVHGYCSFRWPGAENVSIESSF